MSQSLRGAVAAIADERALRDALGGTRRRGLPAPSYVPVVDPSKPTGSMGVVLSSSVGANTVIYSAVEGHEGWVFRGVTSNAGNRFVEGGGDSGFGRPMGGGSANVPSPAQPNVSYYSTPALK